MIQWALRAHLIALETSAGARIYPVILPQSPTLPALTYQRVSEPRQLTHDGVTALVESRYQVTAWAPTYDAAAALAAAVGDGLHGFTGTMGAGGVFDGVDVASVRQELLVDLYEPGVGPPGTAGLHYHAMDFMVQHYTSQGA
jgi:hypothetical protein